MDFIYEVVWFVLIDGCSFAILFYFFCVGLIVAAFSLICCNACLQIEGFFCVYFFDFYSRALAD